MPGYALPMTHPDGITLNRVWTEWATNYGVSSTVAAAVFLISEARPIHGMRNPKAAGFFFQRNRAPLPSSVNCSICSGWRDQRATCALGTSRPIAAYNSLVAVGSTADIGRRWSRKAP